MCRCTCFTVSTGNNADDGGSGGRRLMDHFFEGFQIDKRPDGIMNSDEIGVRQQAVEGVPDRFLARISAFDDTDGFGVHSALENAARPVEVLAAEGHHDFGHQGKKLCKFAERYGPGWGGRRAA